MTPREKICTIDPDMLLMDGEGYDDAIVGFACLPDAGYVAIYDYDLLVKALVENHGMDDIEAAEFISFNIEGSGAGRRSPIVMNKLAGFTH